MMINMISLIFQVALLLNAIAFLNLVYAKSKNPNPQPISVAISTVEYNEKKISEPLNTKITSTLDEELTKAAELSKAVGLSACAYFPNEGLWKKASGVKAFVNESSINNSPITTSSKFHAGSIGKLITATLILTLIEQKKFTLDTKISRWFNDTQYSNVITIEHLLNHTAGLRRHALDNLAGLTLREKSKHTLNTELLFPPGTGFTYSNIGYIILGIILEQEHEQPLAQVIETHFIQKLSLNESVALSSSNKNTALINTAQHTDVDYSDVGGAGILATTPCDLIHILNALLANKIVNAATLQKMTKIAYPMNYEGTLHWTRGLMFLDTPLGRVHFLNGQIRDFSASIIYHPELNVFISVMANNNNTQIFPILFHLLKTIKKTVDSTVKKNADNK